ncbi:MAG TPA: stage II sporulation protein M [Sedimentisphaerales bacterium]|nr:stage II sporulation protein M [Sedimentisphaerales bacterium]
MTPARFLDTRHAIWARLEALTAKASRQGLRKLTDEELHELTRLYPAVAVDVARARMYKVDDATQRRVNQIAIAAHGTLYRRTSGRKLSAVWRFFRHEYPRLFRRQWAFTTLATALFVVAMLGTYAATRITPSYAYLFVPQGLDVSGAREVTAEDISERFRQMPNSPMAAGIMTNNVSVAFFAFALGITAGLGTCYVLLANAMMLGGFAAHFANHGLSYPLWSFLAPHGVLEIFAILVAGAAGLRMGLSLAAPGSMMRSASLRAGAREAVLLLLGTIPMFLIAGFIEGFITPSYIPGEAKIVLGVTVAAVVIAYLTLGGREIRNPNLEIRNKSKTEEKAK